MVSTPKKKGYSSGLYWGWTAKELEVDIQRVIGGTTVSLTGIERTFCGKHPERVGYHLTNHGDIYSIGQTLGKFDTGPKVRYCVYIVQDCMWKIWKVRDQIFEQKTRTIQGIFSLVQAKCILLCIPLHHFCLDLLEILHDHLLPPFPLTNSVPPSPGVHQIVAVSLVIEALMNESF